VIPKSAACGALPDAVNLLAGSLLFLIGTILATIVFNVRRARWCRSSDGGCRPRG
jgi:uncharacterized membrane protein